MSKTLEIIVIIGFLTGTLATSSRAQSHGTDFNSLNFNIGGGIDTPLNPTGRFVGVGGNFRLGAGYNVNKRSSFDGEFGWTGLPSNIGLHLPDVPFGTVNLYTLTADYRYHVDSIKGSAFGAYAIAGGGWYYRHFSVDKNYIVPPSTPCLPVYLWWGYACDTGGVVTQTIYSKGSSAGGVNGGVGMTLRFADSGWKFYMEARYNYGFSKFIHTSFVPVTFGFRFN